MRADWHGGQESSVKSALGGQLALDKLIFWASIFLICKMGLIDYCGTRKGGDCPGLAHLSFVIG